MSADPAADVLLRLPDAERHAFKDPLGDLFTDAEALLASVDGPIIAVGDVVTATLVDAGHHPSVVVVDGYTEREPVDAEVRTSTAAVDRVVAVPNPPATITRSLTAAIVAAIADPAPVRIQVDGEEDLGVIPAILAAPLGWTVVYGQPGEGMVAVNVTAETVDVLRSLLGRLEGDSTAFLAIVGRSEA